MVEEKQERRVSTWQSSHRHVAMYRFCQACTWSCGTGDHINEREIKERNGMKRKERRNGMEWEQRLGDWRPNFTRVTRPSSNSSTDQVFCEWCSQTRSSETSLQSPEMTDSLRQSTKRSDLIDNDSVCVKAGVVLKSRRKSGMLNIILVPTWRRKTIYPLKPRCCSFSFEPLLDFLILGPSYYDGRFCLHTAYGDGLVSPLHHCLLPLMCWLLSRSRN